MTGTVAAATVPVIWRCWKCRRVIVTGDATLPLALWHRCATAHCHEWNVLRSTEDGMLVANTGRIEDPSR
jgi:hypothetical protein